MMRFEHAGRQYIAKNLILIAVALLWFTDAGAWGDLGHKATALIAYRHLSPKARSALDTLLASDTDPLTAPDFASRATWADKYRNDHRETAAWHFIDIEIDHPDIAAACFGFPKSLGPNDRNDRKSPPPVRQRSAL